MAPTLPSFFSASRLRSYFNRLPLLTRLMLLIIAVFGVLELQSQWDVVRWGALVPDLVGLQSYCIRVKEDCADPELDAVYRLNTYPIVHVGILHALLNLFALTPLLERFEAEHGTLLTGALLAGPLSTLPGALYTLTERYILRRNTAACGASIWVFLFLGNEAVKMYRTNPHFTLGDFRIPTWISPLVPLICASALLPNTSLLGHLCGLVIGYIYGLGYLRILAPPERILRWIEGKLNLLGRLPHYVSVDQKTYGRYGVLPSSTPTSASLSTENGVALSYGGSGQRLGP